MAKIIFLHPDLGIGGAERLVVDAALALQKRGFQVMNGLCTVGWVDMHIFWGISHSYTLAQVIGPI